ncbi:MAG: methyltransferase domain-containing protein [Rhodospirillaceae bacterium]|nr:methyltransferase domain-containing protein [Rhodospirillaceae bacterium]
MNNADTAHEDEYSDTLIEFLQMIWGDGFLSPGGPEAARAIVSGLDLADKLVLDIGCGIGGFDTLLAEEFGAQVVGIDIEPGLIYRAVDRVRAKGMDQRVKCSLVKPGPLEFADNTFDVVFGKDSWIHIADKRAFFAEVFRVLKPGGVLAAADWMCGPQPFSPDMEYFFKIEGLTYHMDTPEHYGQILQNTGFVDVTLTDITDTNRELAHKEYESMMSRLKPAMIAALGKEKQEYFVEDWRALTVVLDKGELRPGRFRATKPLDVNRGAN